MTAAHITIVTTKVDQYLYFQKTYFTVTKIVFVRTLSESDMRKVVLLRLRKTQPVANHLCFSFSTSRFSTSRVRDFGIVNSYSWFLNSFKIVDGGGEFSFFQSIYVRTDIITDSSISVRPMTTKFGKQIHLGKLTQMIPIKQVLVTSSRKDNANNQNH